MNELPGVIEGIKVIVQPDELRMLCERSIAYHTVKHKEYEAKANEYRKAMGAMEALAPATPSKFASTYSSQRDAGEEFEASARSHEQLIRRHSFIRDHIADRPYLMKKEDLEFWGL